MNSLLARTKESGSLRTLFAVILVAVSVFAFLGFMGGSYAPTATVAAQEATYSLTTSTGSYYGPLGQLQCSPTGCVYIPGPYQYRVTPTGPGYINGVYYAYVNDNYYPPCQADLNHNVSCSGFVNEAPNGCTELVVVIANGEIAESYWYQYYTLRNLSTNSTINGQFVTVSGQLFTGPNNSSSGASCPGTYINVTSIS